MTTMVNDAHATGRPRVRRPLLSRVLATEPDWGSTVARIVLGLVMLPHGAQKLLGWFGGYGWTGTLGFLTGKVGLPAPIAALVILIESLGALALVAGVAGRVMSAGVAAVMLGAVATVHLGNGFFMNWTGTQGGEGFEYHLLALGLSAVVMISGSGAASVDRALT